MVFAFYSSKFTLGQGFHICICSYNFLYLDLYFSLPVEHLSINGETFFPAYTLADIPDVENVIL